MVLASLATMKSCKGLFQKLHYVYLVILKGQVKEGKYLSDDHENKSILTSGFHNSGDMN